MQLRLNMNHACVHAGKKRRWDVVQAHDSVAVLLFNHQLNAYIIVRQFRPAVHAAKLRTTRAKGMPDPPVAAGVPPAATWSTLAVLFL